MKTSKWLLCVFVVLLFVSSGCGLLKKPTEEELFYRDFLAWFSKGMSEPMYVIEEYSSVRLKNDETLGSFLHPIKTDDYELPQETIDDFIAKNSVPIKFSADMDLGVEYVLLTQAEKEELKKSQPRFWEPLHKKYPNSYGLLTLSQVGFDKEHAHALISFHYYFGSAGAGGYCVFEKEKGHWVYKECLSSWKDAYG